MFKVTTIIKAPSGRFIFVGRVHESLCNKRYDTLTDAKVAAIDCMLETKQTFPIAVSVGESE